LKYYNIPTCRSYTAAGGSFDPSILVRSLSEQ
jgi:hypothetical protein